MHRVIKISVSVNVDKRRSIVYQGKYSSTTVNINVGRTLCVIHELKKKENEIVGKVGGGMEKGAENLKRLLGIKIFSQRNGSCIVSFLNNENKAVRAK